MPSKLIPEKITIQGELKTWGGPDRSAGKSDGSMFQITYSIPAEITDQEFRVQILQNKQRVDILCLLAERLKGTITQEFYKDRMNLLNEAYSKIIKGIEAKQIVSED